MTDLKIVVGATTLHLMVKRAPVEQGGGALFARRPVPPLNPITNTSGVLDFASTNPQQGITESFEDFSRGLGAFVHERGYYGLAENADLRWKGIVMPGPREVVDMTGIAATFRVRKRVLHNGVNMLVTTDLTDTKVYREETGAWALKATFAGAVGTDIATFEGVVAVALGAGTAYQYSSDDGTSWNASTKAGNAKYANFFCVAQPADSEAKAWYVRNPSDVFVTADLTNAGASTTSSTVGDNNADAFNCFEQDDTGLLLMGKRHYLYTMDSVGKVRVVAGPYRYIATSEAGGSAGLANFANPVQIAGRFYFPVEDVRLIEYDHGVITEDLQPAAFGPQYVRLTLPLNALAAANGWLVLALGSSQSTTIRSSDGGSSFLGSILGNTLGATSELYFGRYENGPNGREWVWHGILLVCTKLLKYMWYDDATSYLYLAGSEAALVNLQQYRAFVAPSNPLTTKQGGNVILSRLWYLDTGIYYQNQPNVIKTLRKMYARTGVLSASFPVVGVAYRINDDYESGGFTVLAEWDSAATARSGSSFPASKTFRGVRFRFYGQSGAAANTYGVLYNAQSVHLFYPTSYDQVEFTVQAVNGMRMTNGAQSTTSWKEIRAFLNTWKDSTDPATVTELKSGDSWSMVLADWADSGLGQDRTVTFVGVEVQ